MEDAVKLQRALQKMEAIMLPRKFVKGVLDELLKEYGGWTHIEADNYHLLADQCFERMEADALKLQNGGRMSSQSPDPKPSRRNNKRSSIGAEASLGGYRASPKKSTPACKKMEFSSPKTVDPPQAEFSSPKMQKTVDPPQVDFSSPLRSCIPRGARNSKALTNPYAGDSEASLSREDESGGRGVAREHRMVTRLEAKTSFLRKCAAGKGKEILSGEDELLGDEGKQLVVYSRANAFISADIGGSGGFDDEAEESDIDEENMVLARSCHNSAGDHAGREIVVYSGSAVVPPSEFSDDDYDANEDEVQELMLNCEDLGEPAAPAMSEEDDSSGAATGMAFVKPDRKALSFIAQNYWDDGDDDS